MPDRFVVIIPFYQRKHGILVRAVASALAQEDVTAHVTVIDDSSPVPAEDELRDLMAAHPGRVTILRQPNGGPAAARNRGLENVPAGTEYVAFLDSDDEWTSTHLKNAERALDAGYDFYLADHYQLNQTVSAFVRGGRIDVARFPTIAGVPHLHAYEGDMFAQILRGNIIGTSTVVYRYAAFPRQRFREEFVYAGEDYLFWLDLVRQTPRVAFCSLVECTYGEGVNVFAGSGWGTENSLIRLHYEMKYKRAIARLFELTATQRAENAAAIKRLRRSFVTDVMHRVVKRKPFLAVMKRQATVDPASILLFLPLALSVAAGRRAPSPA